MGLAKENIQGNYSEVMAAILDIEQADKSSEKLSKKGCLVSLLAVLPLIGMGVGAEHLSDLMLQIGLGLAGLLFLVGLIIYAWGKGGDVEDSRYLALRKIHEYLGKDCHESAIFRYSVEFRPFDTLRFFKRIQFPGFFQGRIYHYLTPLISCQVTLRDGTRLRVEFEKLTRKRSRWKFNSRMKLKHKTKHKYLDVIKVFARLPKDATPFPVNTVIQQNEDLTGSKEPKLKLEGRKVAARLVRKGKWGNANPSSVLEALTWTFYQIQKNRA